MSVVEDNLAALGLSVPEVAAPAGSYVPALRNGNLIYTSGQIPTVAGELQAVGKVGAEVSAEEAAACAQTCVLNAIAAVKSVVGDLDKVTQVVKVLGFVASDPSFDGQPGVINGASDLLGKAFGDKGAHARSAVGVAVLPKNVPVEVEIVVAVED
ncbi:RidA family protein [Luteipulveratus mongoliensis]|uniref:LysR family transcriptional regulator n=1 Tax=Luteipulveratus mongoliensis TaxID=571913 RepID=A0A0K1JNI4_9MICO|nr:RidA family protein [Luteipulveratus mongoliensis]AKU18150.1 LysR family transcriptional regulator [Luteipulveratus mongoliensis]